MKWPMSDIDCSFVAGAAFVAGFPETVEATVDDPVRQGGAATMLISGRTMFG
jgi:hypothetical protein